IPSAVSVALIVTTPAAFDGTVNGVDTFPEESAVNVPTVVVPFQVMVTLSPTVHPGPDVIVRFVPGPPDVGLTFTNAGRSIFPEPVTPEVGPVAATTLFVPNVADMGTLAVRDPLASVTPVETWTPSMVNFTVSEAPYPVRVTG